MTRGSWVESHEQHMKMIMSCLQLHIFVGYMMCMTIKFSILVFNIINNSSSFSQEHFGETLPLFIRFMTLTQVEFATRSSSNNCKSISCNTMPLQGKVLLQSNFMATSDSLVPTMFLYSMFLTWTAESCKPLDGEMLCWSRTNEWLWLSLKLLIRVFFYLFIAWTVLITIVLVYDYGIANIFHHNVFKYYVFGIPRSSLHHSNKAKVC